MPNQNQQIDINQAVQHLTSYWSQHRAPVSASKADSDLAERTIQTLIDTLSKSVQVPDGVSREDAEAALAALAKPKAAPRNGKDAARSRRK